MKFLALTLVLLISGSAFAKVTAVCQGTQHKFRIYLVENKDPNRRFELLMRKGLSGKGPVIYRATLSRTPSIDEKLENVSFSYLIQKNVGPIEVLKMAGKIAKFRPVDPRTGVAFRAPVTQIWLDDKGIKLNEMLSCRFRK